MERASEMSEPIKASDTRRGHDRSLRSVAANELIAELDAGLDDHVLTLEPTGPEQLIVWGNVSVQYMAGPGLDGYGEQLARELAETPRDYGARILADEIQCDLERMEPDDPQRAAWEADLEALQGSK